MTENQKKIRIEKIRNVISELEVAISEIENSRSACQWIGHTPMLGAKIELEVILSEQMRMKTVENFGG